MWIALIFDGLFLIYILAASWLFFLCWKRQKRLIAALLALSVLGLIYSGYVEPYWLKVREQKIVFNQLNDEIKVVLVSDWHIRPLKGLSYIRRVTEQITKLQPDVILMAGDFLFHDEIQHFQDELTQIGALTKIAPVYAVLGNHDYGIGDWQGENLYADQHAEISRILQTQGVKILQDAKEKIKIKNTEFWLIGFEEQWTNFDNAQKAVAGLEKDSLLKIGLSHNPDAAFESGMQILDLALSGHTHGGQMRLPWIGALGNADSKLSRRDYGCYLPNHRPQIFNTVGLGEAGPHLRFWNRPEIALLKIK